MKDICLVHWKHTLSLSHLNVNVDLEKVLVYEPPLKWREYLDEGDNFGPMLTDLSKSIEKFKGILSKAF